MLKVFFTVKDQLISEFSLFPIIMVQGLVLSEPILFTSLSEIIRAQHSVLALAYSLMAISATQLNSVCAHHHILM